MSHRLVYLPIAIIGCAAFLIAYEVAANYFNSEPAYPYRSQGEIDLLSTVAAGSVIYTFQLTPTATAYVSPTPSVTPKPPTETPLPTYYPEASPGIRMVPQWTEVPPAAEEVNAELPPCATVTPRPYVDTNCEVRDVPD